MASNVQTLPLTHREDALLRIMQTTTGVLDIDALTKTLDCTPGQVKNSLRALRRKGALGPDGEPVRTLDFLSFTVEGTPRPQGSKDIRGGRVVESSDYLEEWREAISAAAQTAGLPSRPWEGPVELRLRFFFHRSNRTARWTRPTSPPDIDKLERAVWDALVMAGLLRNDSQGAEVHKEKLWTDGSDRLEVEARAMEGA